MLNKRYSLYNPLRILFVGTSDFAVPALKALQSAGYSIPLVVTQPDRPAGRGLELKASPLKKAARELGLEVFQPEKIRAAEALGRLHPLDVDVTVVAAYGQILPPDLLKLPKMACLNIHGSLLPKYRGAAPIHYAVMAGEKETGVTIMYMNEKMDEGDVLLVKKTPIGEEETTGDVHDRLARLGAEGLLEALEQLKQGNAPRIPQDHSKATYAPSLKKEQCLVQWNRPAREIVNQVRGLSPWPVAETRWKDMTLKLFSARVAGDSRSGKPGEVLLMDKRGVSVGTGQGAVVIEEVQPPGKKKMGAFGFTLGHPDFKPGEILS
jgi:methionyl-tRNA formyltransferase